MSYGTRWTLVLFASALVNLPSWTALACSSGEAGDEDLNVSAETVAGSTYANNHKIKVTVTDDDGKGVAGKWVFARLRRGGGWEVGPTGSDGMATLRVKDEAIPNFEGSTIIKCKPKGEDGEGNVNFSPDSNSLSYTGGVMQTVFYSDGSGTSVDTPEESIIGATVEVLGMSFLGIDPDDVAIFGDGTFRIFDGMDVFLTATFSSGSVGTDPLTDTSVLIGQLGDFTFGSGLTSRFIDEFITDLLPANPNPSFFLEMSGNLADVTSVYTVDGLVGGTDSEVGGRLRPIPEPGNSLLYSLGLLAVGFLKLLTAAAESSLTEKSTV